MPIPTEYEILRLHVIVDNKRRLEEALHHENSVYDQLNRRALEDADLYARTGRIRTPSPTPDSDIEGDIEVVSRGGDEDNSRSARENANWIVREVSDELLSQVITVLSSDTESDYCQCETIFPKQKNDDQVITLIDSSDVSIDLGCILKDGDSDTNKNKSASLAPYIDTQEDKPGAKSRRESTKTIVQIPQVEMQSSLTTTSKKYRRSNEEQIGKDTMVTSVKDVHHRPPRLEKDKAKEPLLRQTRVTSKSFAAQDRYEEEEVPDMLNRKGRRRSSVLKQTPALKGKKKGKSISPAVVDVVFGKFKNSIPSVDELRQKREEDSIKCGRVTRTIGHASNEKASLQKKTPTLVDGNSKKDMTTNMPREQRYVNEAHVYKETETPIIEFLEDANDLEDPPIFIAAEEEPTELNLEQVVKTTHASQSTLSRGMVNTVVLSDREAEVVIPCDAPLQVPDKYMRSSSPNTFYRKEYEERSRGRKTISPPHERRSHIDQYYDSPNRSPRHHVSRRSTRQQSRSPRRSRSRSPVYDRRGHNFGRDPKYIDNKGKRSLYDQHFEDSRNKSRGNMSERGRRRSRDSSSSDSHYKNRRSMSPYRGRKQRMRSPTISKSTSPTMSLPPASRDVQQRIEMEVQIGKREDVAVSPSSVDRRTRRYKQKVRETEISKRQTEGKKAFYLTLTSEGKPYGPGKPAWIAEVNKLASWLDPSCTHIRKQTYEDMCILKDRLNDNFEYSGELNEDYLRGLLGKAVTRRRTELIALINKNLERPTSVDIEIWKRLENLASSRQRQERTEHGRYANACRQTVGRTGSLGVEGVRQRLLDRHGRSPDPDEVVEEMQRDKGFGKRKAGLLTTYVTSIEGFIDDTLEEQPSHTRSHRNELEEHITEEVEDDNSVAVRRNVSQMNESVVAMRRTDMDRVPAGRVGGRKIADAIEAKRMSKDEYIAQLEAELQSIRGGTGNASSSRTLLLSKSSISKRDNNDGVTVRYGREKLTTTKRGWSEVQEAVPERRFVDEFAEG